MPAESSEISTIQWIVCVHERINKIVRLLFYTSLKTLLRIKADVLSRSERMFRFFVIDDLQAIIVNLDSIGIGPHLVELIFIFTNNNLSSFVVLQNSNDKLVIQYVLHG